VLLQLVWYRRTVISSVLVSFAGLIAQFCMICSVRPVVCVFRCESLKHRIQFGLCLFARKVELDCCNVRNLSDPV